MEMENKKMGIEHPDNCKCEECMQDGHMHHHMQNMYGGCQYCHMGKHKIVKLIFCLFVLLAVLWIGVKIGELKVLYDIYQPRGLYMMRNISPEGWYGMMGYYPSTSTTSSKSAK